MNTRRAILIASLAATLVVAAAAVSRAEPQQLTIDIMARSGSRFDPAEFRVEKDQSLRVVFINGDFSGRHDIVFELDNGRVERSDVIGFPYERTLLFKSPAIDGVFPYYSSVGNDRANGLEGKMYVGNAQPTAAPEATKPPSSIPYETVLEDLANPHGLSVTGPITAGAGLDEKDPALLVSEGGTGASASGAFQPGAGDGRVLEAPLERLQPHSVVIDELTNSVNPGGGIIGANHAIHWEMDSTATGTASVTLVAVAGGPGHLRPGEAAKVLAVDADGNRTVVADTMAFERANNPDGGDPDEGGIDSNPWRLVPDPDREFVYIVDAGANDILKLDPASHELTLFAVFEPVWEDQQAVPSGMVWGPAPSGAAIVSLFGGSDRPTGQLRVLRDENGDGAALDPGENQLLVDGIAQPSDIVVNDDGSAVYVAEMGRSSLSVFDTVGGNPPSRPYPRGASVKPVAIELYGISGLALAPSGDMFASVYGWPADEGGVQMQTDRVVKIGADVVATPTPTPYRTTPTPTVEPTTPTPTATGGSPEPNAEPIFLPATLKGGGFE